MGGEGASDGLCGGMAAASVCTRCYPCLQMSTPGWPCIGRRVWKVRTTSMLTTSL